MAVLYLFLKTFSRAIYNKSHFFFKRCVDGKFSSEEKVIWISDEEREKEISDEERGKEISDEETEKVNNCCCCSRSSSSRAGVHA